MRWGQGQDSITETFLLTQSKRTSDPWLKEVLSAHRYGTETWEIYCAKHRLVAAQHWRAHMPGGEVQAADRRDLARNVET